jgi:hypothetical protein
VEEIYYEQSPRLVHDVQPLCSLFILLCKPSCPLHVKFDLAHLVPGFEAEESYLLPITVSV